MVLAGSCGAASGTSFVDQLLGTALGSNFVNSFLGQLWCVTMCRAAFGTNFVKS